MVRVERLDHLGLIAAVINDLGLVSIIDARLTPDEQEAITPGEAIKGMILNGLGFANRPWSLTPQFFANNPLDLLFRPGVEAAMFNRFKLGRTLDEVDTYGCDLFFSEIALAGCQQEAIDQRFNASSVPILPQGEQFSRVIRLLAPLRSHYKIRLN